MSDPGRPLPQAKDPLDPWRKRFPIVGRTNYLISNSLGAMPAEAKDDLAEYADTWAARGVRAWGEGWWEMALAVGDLVGRIVHAPPGSVTMHQNVSLASAVVSSCMEWRGARNRVVMVDMEFPSLLYLYHRMGAHGARVHVVKSRDGVTLPMDELLDAIDGKTALVPISHVLFRSSYLVDAKAIVEKAHRVGARVCLDAFQSAGTVPVDLASLGTDFAVGGALKWLCGGPGAAWLYVRPDLRGVMKPRVTGWQAHAAPFAFEAGPIRFRDDGGRFLTGTPNVPGLYAARAGLRIVGEIGAEAIRAKSLRQTERLIALADREGWEVTAPRDPERRGGTVAIDVPNGAAVSAELNARDIVVDYRPGAGVRLSPHFYTRDRELDAAVAAIREILETNAYEKHLHVAPDRHVKRLLDISQAVDASTAPWPGDTPFSAKWVAHLDEGAPVTVSSITTSPHNGTHADAPCHFAAGAPGIGEVDVAKYVGPCRVVERIGTGPVTATEVRRWRPRKGDRILVRTRKRVDPSVFPARFAHLTGESAALLARAGVVLFGIDTPSVDHRDSKTMDAHRALLAGGTAILENLDLSRAKPGRYRLIAPPVKYRGLDAGPVRALLER